MAEKKTAPEGEVKSKKTLFILIGVGVLVALLAAAGGAWFMSRSSSPEASTPAPSTQLASGGDSAGIGPMVDIEAFVINILDEKESRYLKAAITLEVDSPNTVTDVSNRMPQIRDAILLLVGNKTYSELADLQGKLQLRAELAAKLNSLLQGGQVRKIYFTEFVVQ